MVSEHGSVGVIVLSKEGLARFDDDDLRLLEVIAAHAAIACENVRLIAEQQEAADISEALLELGAALSLQENVEGIASMLAIAIDRLVECAGISIWKRDGDMLVPATTVGSTPSEAHRLMRTRLRVTDQPLAAALSGRGIASLDLDQTPALTGCLDAAPAGTTYAVIAIGERARNRGAVIVQRGPRRGPISPRDQRMLLGIADHALLALTHRALYRELDASCLAAHHARPLRRARPLVPGHHAGPRQRAGREGCIHQRPRPGPGRPLHGGRRPARGGRLPAARHQRGCRPARPPP